MNITIADQRLNDLFYITNVQGVHDLPSARGLVNAFGMGDGSNYCGTVFEERVITITGTMLMGDGKSLAEKMDMLKKIIAPTGEKEILLGAYPDRYIKGRYEGSMNLEQVCQMGNFSLTFYCSNPFYYDLVPTTFNNQVAANCMNKGTWPSQKLQVELTLNGQCTINNATTNQNLVLKGTNKKVIIDFEKACIIGGVADNANTCFVSGNFFDLQPGNNMLTSTVPSIFRYRSCYL